MLIDFDKLRSWFIPSDRIFDCFRKHTLDYEDKQRHRIFIDRGSKILFVAHIDSVQYPQYYGKKRNRIYARGVDDKVGCWLAYVSSKKFNTDLLLCNNEESCDSTAQYHICKDYNWIAEFDRAGEDVVLYSCGSADFRKALQDFFKIGIGSFSDISFLKTTACCVNIGIGYEHPHRKNSYVDLRVLERQIAKFEKFYRKYKDIAFERDDKAMFTYRDWWDEDWGGEQCQYPQPLVQSDEKCELCGILGTMIYGHALCNHCFDDMYYTYMQFFPV